MEVQEHHHILNRPFWIELDRYKTQFVQCRKADDKLKAFRDFGVYSIHITMKFNANISTLPTKNKNHSDVS